MSQSIRECQQCQGTTRAGRRCSRSTCMYYKFCFQHAQNRTGLAVKNSLIPRAGKGLFAVRNFPRGTTFKYKGEILTARERDARYPGDMLGEYVLCYGRGRGRRCVDARSTQSCLARYANDARGTRFRHNAEFVDPARGERWPLLRLTRDVQAGEEILVFYSDEYWER